MDWKKVVFHGCAQAQVVLFNVWCKENVF